MYSPKLLGAVLCIAACSPAMSFARSPTENICKAAVAFATANNLTMANGTVLFAENNFVTSDWALKPYDGRITTLPNVQQVYFAYFINRPYVTAGGAVAVKISRSEVSGSNDRTNFVDLHRSEIYRDTNSCEPRGRRQIDQQVRVNEYIDYHNGDVLSSNLERFHIQYPRADSSCQRTDNILSRRSFQFPDVNKTEGDSFIARTFSFVGTAYAVGHKFSMLKTELHYVNQSAAATGACVGIQVPLGQSTLTNAVISEQGFNDFLYGQTLVFDRKSQN